MLPSLLSAVCHGGVWICLLVLVAAPTFAQAPERSLPSQTIQNKIDEQARLIEANAAHHRKMAATLTQMNATLAKFAAAARDDDDKIAPQGTVQAVRDRLLKQRLNELQKWQELEESMERKRMKLVKENFRDVQVWDQTIQQALVKYRPGIHSGDLLNRVFGQIERSSGLSSAYAVSPSVSEGLVPLEEKSLQQLQLTMNSVNGSVGVSLGGRLPPAMNRWPYLFTDPELAPHVQIVNHSVAALVQLESNAVGRFAAEKEVFRNIEQAAAALDGKYPPGQRRGLKGLTIRRILDAERFLQELSRNVATLAETAEQIERPSYFDRYPPDQRNVASLIQYMTLYGLKFTPAKAGQEPLYDVLFREALTLAKQLNAAPSRESISEPIINLDLDAAVRDPGDP